MNPNTFQLTQERPPIVNIDELRRRENEKMFQFLPVLRNQSQFVNGKIGYMPNREINAILNQTKLNQIANAKDGSRVYPSGSYQFNMFPR